jgi:hypothetical protein
VGRADFWARTGLPKRNIRTAGATGKLRPGPGHLVHLEDIFLKIAVPERGLSLNPCMLPISLVRWQIIKVVPKNQPTSYPTSTVIHSPASIDSGFKELRWGGIINLALEKSLSTDTKWSLALNTWKAAFLFGQDVRSVSCGSSTNNSHGETDCAYRWQKRNSGEEKAKEFKVEWTEYEDDLDVQDGAEASEEWRWREKEEKGEDLGDDEGSLGFPPFW